MFPVAGGSFFQSVMSLGPKCLALHEREINEWMKASDKGWIWIFLKIFVLWTFLSSQIFLVSLALKMHTIYIYTLDYKGNGKYQSGVQVENSWKGIYSIFSKPEIVCVYHTKSCYSKLASWISGLGCPTPSPPAPLAPPHEFKFVFLVRFLI